MAKEVKAGNWLFRISDNQRDLQRASLGSSSYSHVWSAPNGERILDILAKGEDVVINTERNNYVRSKSGGVSLK
jgi:hypothetical protein